MGKPLSHLQVITPAEGGGPYVGPVDPLPDACKKKLEKIAMCGVAQNGLYTCPKRVFF